MHAMHSGHVHHSRAYTHEEFPRHGMRTVNRIQNRRLRIERDVTADGERSLFRIPNIACAADCVSSDAKRRMMVSDAETDTVSLAQQLVFVRQFESRIEIIPVEKLHRGFCHITIQVENFAPMAFMVSTPYQTRSPVAAIERPVVTDRGGSATHVAGFKRLGIFQEPVTHLHGPIAIRRKPQSRRARVPRMCLEVVAMLIRLAAVKE